MMCCAIGAEQPTRVSPELLEETIYALDVKLKAIRYQCTQLTLRAKQFRAQGDELRCMEELKLRREKEVVYKKWVALYGNVCRIRDSIDQTHAMGELTSTMSVANQSLKEALLKVDLEKIEDLMDQLEEGMEQVNEVGEVLGNELGPQPEIVLEDIDELELPDVPTTVPKVQKPAAVRVAQ